MRYLLLVAILYSCLGTAHAAGFPRSCGIAPIPPIPPIGASECRMVQVIDAEGNCYWVAVCE